MPIEKLALPDVYSAKQKIAPIARRTPLAASQALRATTGAEVRLKLENQQVTGSFKIRGAANKLFSLTKAERGRGVITVSSGNHGRALAYAAQELGVRATICVAKTVPENKVQAIQALGAELIVAGENADEAMEQADKLQAERGLTMVHPFDDLEIIAGQGSIAVEIIEDFADLDTVIVPLSGGGLLSGIAFAIKMVAPKVRVVGVSMERGPAMVESLKAGKIIDIVEEPTLADALAGGLNKDNRFTLPLVRDYMDEAVLVSEDEIAEAVYFCLEAHQMVVEGGGAVGVAALLSKKVEDLGERVAVVLSGANISVQTLRKIMAERENAA